MGDGRPASVFYGRGASEFAAPRPGALKGKENVRMNSRILASTVLLVLATTGLTAPRPAAAQGCGSTTPWSASTGEIPGYPLGWPYCRADDFIAFLTVF